MINEILVGIQNNGDGIRSSARGGQQGEQLVSQLHGRFYEQALRGNLFHVSNQAAVSTTAGLATTFTGLAVANPAGNSHNLVLLAVGVGQVAAGAAGAVGIMTGSGAAAGALTARNALIGGGASKMAAPSASATIATPVLDRVFGSVGSVATTGYGLVAGLQYFADGSIVIPPGYFVASYTSAATTSATIWTFVWEEVPIR
jgi:hypothetical protein